MSGVATAPKYWTVEYFDRGTWKPTGSQEFTYAKNGLRVTATYELTKANAVTNVNETARFAEAVGDGVIRFRIRCASGACQTDGKSVPTEPGSASTIRIRQLSTGGLDAIAVLPGRLTSLRNDCRPHLPTAAGSPPQPFPNLSKQPNPDMENFYLKPLATSLHGLRRLTAAVLLLLFAVTAEPAAAGEQDSGRQQPTIQAKGRVVDTNGIAIAGAAVTVKGGSAGGTISDAQGAFTLRVRKGDVLHVSFLGFQAREIAVTDASPLTIRLAEETHQVEDVVVVGYGVQKKESVLGAISQVNNEQLVNSGTTNITNAIAGKLSGVTTIQTGGQPGNNDANIFIRGVSSWNGSTPLVLVDGVERSFADIDPNEVASLSVLKDASATAVFGAKGANGVIIVTTRTGSTGKPKMNISLSYGLDFPTMIPDHIGSAQTAELLNVALKNAQSYGSMIPRSEIEEYARPSSRINSIRYPDNDRFDIAMRRCAQTINANYNVSGGSQRVKYFLSLGYSHEGSIFKDFSSGATPISATTASTTVRISIST